MIEKTKTCCRKAFSAAMLWTLRILVRLAFRPKLTFSSPEAKANFPKDPCVLISNHINTLDVAPIETLLHKKHFYGMMAADIIRDYKLIGWFISFAPSITIDRHNITLSWLREGKKLLQKGHSIFMCPEGRCNADKVLSEFKPGFVTLAAKANAPVVPLYHNGEFNYFFGKRFRLIVGEPITLTPPQDGLTDEFMRSETARAAHIVRKLEMQLMGQTASHEAPAANVCP